MGAVASSSASVTDLPCAAHWLSMVCCSSCDSSPTSSRPSTNSRSPTSVGRRPAEVWGANSSPISSRSDMTLRMVAGDSGVVRRRDSVREPMGSPVVTYSSTISRKISRERSFNSLTMPLGAGSMTSSW